MIAAQLPARRFPHRGPSKNSPRASSSATTLGSNLAYVYFEDEPQRQMSIRRQSWRCLGRGWFDPGGCSI